MSFVLPTIGGGFIAHQTAAASFSNTRSLDFASGTNEFATCGDVGTLNNASAFTVSCWVYVATANKSGNQAIFSVGPTGNDQIRLFKGSSQEIRMDIKNGGSGTILTTTASNPITINSWNHVAFTFAAGTGKIYINGTLKATSTSFPSSTYTYDGATDDTFNMGRLRYLNTHYWNGFLDEFAIWNATLSDADITSIYNSGVPNDLSAAASYDTDRTGNLKQWWRMEEGSGTTVDNSASTDTANDASLDLTNSPTFSTFAPPFKNTYSVDFDGTNDFVSTSSFNLTTNKTVSFWIKLDSISSAGVYLFGKGASYYSYITSNGRTMYKYDGSSAPAINISAANAITTGVWQHIVITGNGSTSVLYKNGASIGTGTDVTPLGLDRFAGDSVGGSRFVDGLMDEVAVWNAELSANDVTAIYNSGVPNNLLDASSYNTDRTSNLVHWWRMGEYNLGTGTTITDLGSGSNNGTLTNGPTFSTTVPS